MKHPILNELFLEKVRALDDLNRMISECDNLLATNKETETLLEIKETAKKYTDSWVFDFQTLDQNDFDKKATGEEVITYVNKQRKELSIINMWLFDRCKRFLHKHFDDNTLKEYFWYLLDAEIKRNDPEENM